MKYVIVSPVRNEEKNIEKTLASVSQQTILPLKWIVVNDGSTDKTRQIVERFVDKFSWIQVVDRKDRGFRLPGKGIVEAFYEGFDLIKDLPWDFVVKLDCDLSFGSNYFANMVKEFSKNSSLGIASGKTYIPMKDDVRNLKLEWSPDTCTRGPCKMYRRECFEKIGGLRRERGWDTLDDIAAMVEGYTVRGFGEYQLIHHRPIGTLTKTDRGLKSRWDMGKNFYYIGYHPLFVFLKSLKMTISDRPLLLAGMVFLVSYLGNWITDKPRIDDRRLIMKLQDVQLKRIFGKL